MLPDGSLRGFRPFETRSRGAFEKDRGVTAVNTQGTYAHLVLPLGISPSSSPEQAPLRQLEVFRVLSAAGVSINLVKLHGDSLSFVINEADTERSVELLVGLELQPRVTSSVSLVSVYAAGMRGLSGIMARIAQALLRAEVPILQTGDGPDTVFCIVDASLAGRATSALCVEFDVPPPQKPLVVQKFGGRSVGNAEARRLAAERVQEAIADGNLPVVVVSAIGRMGEPYATDTLLSHLDAVDSATEPNQRERDLLMACGEIISTVIMAQTLKALGLRAIALTGGQAGILTDDRYGDAQILDIDPRPIRQIFAGDEADVVVVAGFQGVTEAGAITTLGRGGSDTTAAALGAALKAAKVEIYTHVNGVMTADPEVAPDARTLRMVTYEEVCNMAHQGAKVLHPRAAEIAMMHQIPLWVKTSFERKEGTLIAPLQALQSPQHQQVTGVATLGKLVYFTLQELNLPERARIEADVYRTVGDAGINFYLNSIGPDSSSFLVEQAHARRTEHLLKKLDRPYESVEDCEMVSVVALNMWEAPGFLLQIAEALYGRDIPVLQMADSECSVSCLVKREHSAQAVRVLHEVFGLGQ